MVIHCIRAYLCLDTVLPLHPARSGRESEVDFARLSLTIIQFTTHVVLIIYIQQQQAHKGPKNGKRKDQRVPQSQTAAPPRHQEKEETD